MTDPRDPASRAPAQSGVPARWAGLRASHDVDSFVDLCATAHANAPEHAETGTQYAEALGLAGRWDEKLALLTRLHALHPRQVSVNISLGIEHLIRGDYRKGWPHFAYRTAKARSMRSIGGLGPERRWKGGTLAGQRLMLKSEQGLGDAIQFVRYAILARRAGAHPLIDVHVPLRRLFGQSPAIEHVLTGNSQVEIHSWLPMLDLVPLFTPTRADITWPGPYIGLPADNRPFALPGPRQGLRVGLAWQGNADNRTDFARSMALSDLAPLRAATGCRFYSLMPKDAADALRADPDVDWITDLSALTTPFERLAAAIAALDVVVTVCTSIAHLAGAMGKPTILMLSAMPDWRWGRTGSTTPWYPSATIHRQTRLGDWRPVVEAVTRDLQAL